MITRKTNATVKTESHALGYAAWEIHPGDEIEKPRVA